MILINKGIILFLKLKINYLSVSNAPSKTTGFLLYRAVLNGHTNLIRTLVNLCPDC